MEVLNNLFNSVITPMGVLKTKKQIKVDFRVLNLFNMLNNFFLRMSMPRVTILLECVFHTPKWQVKRFILFSFPTKIKKLF